MLLAHITALFDHGYWATRRVLDRAARLTDSEFVAPSITLTRDLRRTLIHTLDTEMSWRARIRGEPEERWKPEQLPLADYPSVPKLVERWRQDETEMRAWLRTLTDEEIAREVVHGARNALPLWHFLLHMVMHSAQHRSEAAAMLSQRGQSPGDIDFLDYLDEARGR